MNLKHKLKVKRTDRDTGEQTTASVDRSELEAAIADYITHSGYALFGRVTDPFEEDSVAEAAAHYADTVLKALDKRMGHPTREV